jgi:tRNA(Arg) A34 adenosine deaminase TadA
LFPGQALSLLRNRIFVDRPLSPVCEGMIKVAAKRFEVVGPEEWDSRFTSFTGDRNPVTPPTTSTLTHTREPPSGAVEELLADLKLKSDGFPRVSSVLLDPEGKVLLASWSMTASDRTAHAEVNLVEAWFTLHSQSVPSGSSLHVSLRPCAMCAAQILALTGIPSGLRVVFHEEDPGPASKNSCLVPGSDLWKKAGSPDWQAWPAGTQDE